MKALPVTFHVFATQDTIGPTSLLTRSAEFYVHLLGYGGHVTTRKGGRSVLLQNLTNTADISVAVILQYAQ